MILFGVVCILNMMVIGCGYAAETAVKTEETQPDEIMSEEADVPIKNNDGDREEPQENAAGKWQVLEPHVAAAVNKVEISYRGTLDNEEHPSEAVKIVVITVE